MFCSFGFAAFAVSVVVLSVFGIRPGSEGVLLCRAYGFSLRGSADGAGVGHDALGRMSGCRGDGTIVPGVFSSFGLAAFAVPVMVLSVFGIRPGSEGVLLCRAYGFSLRGSADGAGVGHDALGRMSGCRGDGTIVPGVFRGFRLAAFAVSVVMQTVIRICPSAVGVGGRRGDGFGLGGSADGAGVGHDALGRMGGRRGYGTVVPGVGLGFRLTAFAISVVVQAVLGVRPVAE